MFVARLWRQCEPSVALFAGGRAAYLRGAAEQRPYKREPHLENRGIVSSAELRTRNPLRRTAICSMIDD
jgi:hypothetical protein